jgi:hypothetical protein
LAADDLALPDAVWRDSQALPGRQVGNQRVNFFGERNSSISYIHDGSEQCPRIIQAITESVVPDFLESIMKCGETGSSNGSEPGGDMNKRYTRTKASVPCEELCMGAMRKIYTNYTRMRMGVLIQ